MLRIVANTSCLAVIQIYKFRDVLELMTQDLLVTQLLRVSTLGSQASLEIKVPLVASSFMSL